MKLHCLFEDRRKGLSLPETGYDLSYVVIYRAVPAPVRRIFPMDYVTRSLKFAHEHAEHVAGIEDDTAYVLKAVVRADKVFNAYNPGEYFYDGDPVDAKIIRVVEPRYGFDEQIAESARFRQDNPGGAWLKDKIDHAREIMMKSSGPSYSSNLGSGSITGYFTDVLRLDPKSLQDIPGATGEERYRMRGERLDWLRDSIEQHGYHPSPILIMVNHLGEPYVVEGNHRLAEAILSDRPYIEADIRYINGGEDVPGPLHPSKIDELIYQG